MENNRRSVTIRDVAETAGVSVSTVSRVLNGKVDVAKETKNHILSIIDDLGYSTNLAARSMRSQKKNLIGLIMPDIAYPFAIEVMKVSTALSRNRSSTCWFTRPVTCANAAGSPPNKNTLPCWQSLSPTG